MRRATILLLVWVAACSAWAAQNTRTDLSSHITLAHLSDGWGAAWDFALSGVFLVLPQFGLGIEGGLLWPLPVGNRSRSDNMILRAWPHLYLSTAGEDSWAYLAAGCGWEGLFGSAGTRSNLSLFAKAGFCVAPRDLLLHFGFEIFGGLGMVGPIETEIVGLGGFLGLRL